LGTWKTMFTTWSKASLAIAGVNAMVTWKPQEGGHLVIYLA